MQVGSTSAISHSYIYRHKYLVNKFSLYSNLSKNILTFLEIPKTYIWILSWCKMLHISGVWFIFEIKNVLISRRVHDICLEGYMKTKKDNVCKQCGKSSINFLSKISLLLFICFLRPLMHFYILLKLHWTNLYHVFVLLLLLHKPYNICSLYQSLCLYIFK